MLEVVILGSGNVGNHLVQRFEKSTLFNGITGTYPTLILFLKQ